MARDHTAQPRLQATGPRSKRAANRRNPRTAHKRSRKWNPLSLEVKCLMEVCRAVNTARSLAVYIIAREGLWDEYLALTMPDVNSPTFADDYLVTEMLRKNPLLPVSIDPEEEATKTWFESEAHCAKINELFSAYSEGRCSLTRFSLVERVRDKLAALLGPLDSATLQIIEEGMRFGPGASTSVRGRDVLPSRKPVASFDVTPKLQRFVRSLLPCVAGRPLSHDLSLRTANIVTFVPKTSKTHRAISIEPHANIYAQLGVGAYLKKRFYAATGVRLSDQAHVNRRLVLRAHKLGLATIDLSSASDSIGTWLLDLLPVDWAYLLDTLRCEYSEINGCEVRLNKLAGMGNGFTFELETLLFMAICYAVGLDKSDVSVFGDDIIVPQESARRVIEALEYFGFRTNEKKTFTAGVFFESCGVDVWRGVNVRPFYLKGIYESPELASVRICNKIRLYAYRVHLGHSCDRRFLRPWLRILETNPASGRTAVPLGSSDDGLIRNFDEATPSRWGRGWDGYRAIVFSTKSRIATNSDPFGLYYLGLSRVRGSVTDYQSLLRVEDVLPLKETVRGHTTATGSLTSIFVREWPSIGPWL